MKEGGDNYTEVGMLWMCYHKDAKCTRKVVFWLKKELTTNLITHSSCFLCWFVVSYIWVRILVWIRYTHLHNNVSRYTEVRYLDTATNTNAKLRTRLWKPKKHCIMMILYQCWKVPEINDRTHRRSSENIYWQLVRFRMSQDDCTDWDKYGCQESVSWKIK